LESPSAPHFEGKQTKQIRVLAAPGNKLGVAHHISSNRASAGRSYQGVWLLIRVTRRPLPEQLVLRGVDQPAFVAEA
jgi:hypothetical protein